MVEEWKDCPEAENFYEVSNLGNVKRKSTKKLIKRFINRLGYYNYFLYIKTEEGEYKRLVRLAHRLVAKAFIENPNKYREVNHDDGNKGNNVVSNLYWCTRSQNMKHGFSNGLMSARRAERNNKTKLTWDKVREIRQLRSTTTLVKLAEKYDVTAANISEICNNKTWREDDYK
jgi:hypothetical protein